MVVKLEMHVSFMVDIQREIIAQRSQRFCNFQEKEFAEIFLRLFYWIGEISIFRFSLQLIKI